ncbi:UTRA domain-containing protein [Corynebacterium sp. HMSC061H03]|uniref:UTRA domain-containing protein n=1 Tax=Corynebacterium sp. HMSC061H03 TaxID=1739291 RepID=UPI0021109A58|nr:UTRA domain-containing protein [Corynebacterium sp. HMSC061H03]
MDAVPANEEDAALLKIQVGAPLLRVRRRAFTLDGVPIEASDDRYLASQANFSVTTARGNASPISLQAGEGVRERADLDERISPFPFRSAETSKSS